MHFLASRALQDASSTHTLLSGPHNADNHLHPLEKSLSLVTTSWLEIGGASMHGF